MPDAFRHVQPGQPVIFSAAEWNAMKDAARAHQQRLLDQTSESLESFRQADIIKIRNDSGGPLGRFSVLGIDGPVFDPSGSAAEELAFQNQVILKGITPASEHRGKFAILLEPIPEDGVGRAWVGGVCPVLIDVDHEDHKCVDIALGDTSMLRSCLNGSASILWQAGTLGEQWAIVRLGSGCRSDAGDGLTGQSDRCQCPEDVYEVEVACGPCQDGYTYDPCTDTLTVVPSKMPLIYQLVLRQVSANPYGYDTDLCSTWTGDVIDLRNDGGYAEPTCSWSGTGPHCQLVELNVGTETVTISIEGANGENVLLTIPASTFECCKDARGWEGTEGDSCLVDAVLLPHPCTCCPPEPTLDLTICDEYDNLPETLNLVDPCAICLGVTNPGVCVPSGELTGSIILSIHTWSLNLNPTHPYLVTWTMFCEDDVLYMKRVIVHTGSSTTVSTIQVEATSSQLSPFIATFDFPSYNIGAGNACPASTIIVYE